MPGTAYVREGTGFRPISLEFVRETLRGLGVPGVPLIMRSRGGIVSAALAAQQPVQFARVAGHIGAKRGEQVVEDVLDRDRLGGGGGWRGCAVVVAAGGQRRELHFVDSPNDVLEVFLEHAVQLQAVAPSGWPSKVQ